MVNVFAWRLDIRVCAFFVGAGSQSDGWTAMLFNELTMAPLKQFNKGAGEKDN